MKRILTLSLLILGVSAASAQTASKNNHQPKHNPYRDLAHRLVNANKPQAANKTTAMKQRVIAESGYSSFNGSLFFSDTTSFKYSGYNGSTFDYDMTYHNYYYPATEPGIEMYQYGRTDVMADTVRYWSYDGTSLELMEQVANSFYPGNLLKEQIGLTQDPSDNYRVINQFDGQGRVTSQYVLSWINNQWDTTSRRDLAYNGNEILHDSTFDYSFGDWTLTAVNEYTYTAGQLTQQVSLMDIGSGSGIVPFLRVNIEYYPTAYPKDIVIELDFGSGFTPAYRDTMAFAPGGKYMTYEREQAWDELSGSFVDNYLTTKTVNTLALPDTVRYYEADGGPLEQTQFMTTTFNSYGNPVLMNTYDLIDGTPELSYVYNFYYETYDDPTSVGNTPEKADITIYPNPASNQVNISWKSAPGKPVSLQLTNAAGQTVHTESLTWKQQTEQVNISHLPSGLYWITIGNANGMISRQTIVKQ